MKDTKFLTQAALIGAAYAVLTIILAPISYGIMQVRIAEALTVLPFFTSAAVPGLFIGCLIANIYGGAGIADIIIGSLTTLSAAYLSAKVKKKCLVPLPPIILNALIIGTMLYTIFLNTGDKTTLLAAIGWVGLGQTIACYGLGYPLLILLEKYKDKLFSK